MKQDRSQTGVFASQRKKRDQLVSGPKCATCCGFGRSNTSDLITELVRSRGSTGFRWRSRAACDARDGASKLKSTTTRSGTRYAKISTLVSVARSSRDGMVILWPLRQGTAPLSLNGRDLSTMF